MNKVIGITELAAIANGKVVGDLKADIEVTGTCAIDKYVPARVSFVRNAKYAHMLSILHNAVILIPQSLDSYCEKYPQNVYIIVEDVLSAIMDVQDFFYQSERLMINESISPTATIDRSARIGVQVYVGEHVYIGKNVSIGNGAKILHNSTILDNIVIGNNTYIYPGVCIYDNCRLGNDCLIHSGVRIGIDGFRFEQDFEQKRVRKMIHMGGVVIGDRVEIGANSAIDRATFEGSATVISDDVKIDNLVHIAHNVEIGARTVIVTQSCIGGGDKIGEDVWIGIGAAISNGVRIGNRAKVLLNAVVAYDVAEGEIVSGFYAMPHKQWKRVWSKWKKET